MKNKLKYSLEERTLEFSKKILNLSKEIKLNYYNKNIIDQLIRSTTSIGANYCEANGASSKKDFRNKISICKKESKETRYWLLLLKECERKEVISNLLDTNQEFILIFSKIISTIDNSKNKNSI